MRLRRTVIAVVLAAGAVALAQERTSSSSGEERSSSRRSERSSSSDRSSRDRSSRSDRDRSGRSSSAQQWAATQGSAAMGGATTRPTSFLEGYRLVLDRNIFSKTRVIYREPSATTGPSSGGAGYRQQEAMTLTGVTREGGVVTALIEDRRSGRTGVYHVGDAIGEGKVTGIDLDSIEYTTGAGKVNRIELGSGLEGGPMYSVSSSGSGVSGYRSSGTSGSVATTGPAAAPGASPAGGVGDALERMRQRRLQETKQ